MREKIQQNTKMNLYFDFYQDLWVSNDHSNLAQKNKIMSDFN